MWSVENYANSPATGTRSNFGGSDLGNGIKGAWIAFSASSDTILDSIKNKFVACEINLSYKNSQGESIDGTFLVVRKLTEDDVVKINDGFKIENMKVKGFAQDGGNVVEILKNINPNDENAGGNTQGLSVSVRLGLFEGDVNDKKLGFKQSEVDFADWSEDGSGWKGSNKGQTKDMWSAYAQSPIGKDRAYVSKNDKDSPKKLEDIKSKALDVASEYSKPQEIHDNY